MSEIRGIKVKRLVLSGVPRHRQQAVAAAIERALAESAANVRSDPTAKLATGLGTTLGRAVSQVVTDGSRQGPQR